MRRLILLLVLWFVNQMFAEVSLPPMSANMVNEIQRLSIIIQIAEFPHAQKDILDYLSLPVNKMIRGTTDKNRRVYFSFALSDPNDSLGYYGFNIYYGKIQPDGSPPMVDDIELFFSPGNTGNYPPLGRCVIEKGTDASIIAGFRSQMRECKLSLKEFVESLYKKRTE